MSRRDVAGRYAPEAGPGFTRELLRGIIGATEPTHARWVPATDALAGCGPRETHDDDAGVVYFAALRGFVDAETRERRVVAEYVGTGGAYHVRPVAGARLARRDGEFAVVVSGVDPADVPRALGVAREDCKRRDEVAHIDDHAEEAFDLALSRHAALETDR